MPPITRRRLFAAAAPAILSSQRLSPIERIQRALNGIDVDQPPISLWHHFGLEKQGPEAHAKATLAFHRDYSTDVVKVMSDFPFPSAPADFRNLHVHPSPFPSQLRALQIIARELRGKAWFVETIFNPWNVAEKLTSKEQVLRLKQEQPQQLLDALSAIAKSEANHARKAVETGAAGIFLAVANAGNGVLSEADYEKFSEPFDREVLMAVGNAPLNILHIHGKDVPLRRFYKGWPCAALNFSTVTAATPLSAARATTESLLAGGVDEVNYRTLSVEQLRSQAAEARRQAGNRLLLTPGCSVPNDSTPEELRRLAEAVRV